MLLSVVVGRRGAALFVVIAVVSLGCGGHGRARRIATDHPVTPRSTETARTDRTSDDPSSPSTPTAADEGGALPLLGRTSIDPAVERALRRNEDEVELLEAGAPPREVLRYAIGTEPLRARVRIGGSLEVSVNGEKPRVGELPEAELVLGIDPEPASGGEAFAIAVHVERAELADSKKVEPELARQLEADLERLRRTRGRVVYDNRGQIVSSELTGASGDSSLNGIGLAELLDEPVVPLPEEAVGEGARWQYRRRVQRAGVQFEHTVTYTLGRDEDGALVLEGSIAQRAGRQAMQPPGGGQAMAALERLDGSGTDRVPFDRNAPLAFRDMELTVEAVTSVMVPGQGLQHISSTVTARREIEAARKATRPTGP